MRKEDSSRRARRRIIVRAKYISMAAERFDACDPILNISGCQLDHQSLLIFSFTALYLGGR